MCIRILNSRQIINVAGKYACKVTRVGNATTTDGRVLFIVDTNLMTTEQVARAEALLAEGKYDVACNQKASFISQFAPNYTPSKGEIVNAIVEKADDNNLYVRSFSAIPVAPTSKHTFGSALEDSAPVEQEPVKAKVGK